MKARHVILFLGLFFNVLFPQNNKSPMSSVLNASPIDTLLKIGLNLQLGSSPLFYQNRIYTSELSGIISCFDNSGKKIWSRNTSNTLHSRPVIADNILCAATSKNEIVTFSLDKGSQIQSFGIDDSITTDLILLQYSGEKELMMPKTIGSKSAIVFGTNKGKIFCYDLETLQEYWHNSDAQEMIKTQPIVVDNKLLFTSKDGFLYCIDARNGLLNWRWKEKAETDFSNSQIVSDGRKVYVIDNENSLFSIDLLLGNFTWRSPAKVFGAVGISIDKKKLYAKGLYSKFYILSAMNGKVLKEIRRYDLFEEDNISPFEYKKRILFTNMNSIIFLDEKYKESIVLTFGSNLINSFTQIDKNKFLVSNSTGSIIIFSIR
ncbi:MAG: PQQ-like beta-propeller repeat protein [Ignavibacteriales bacterium]|nr:PQQ-like beta-propeller repeat protein [Ignavibacteriales bacterium]